MNAAVCWPIVPSQTRETRRLSVRSAVIQALPVQVNEDIVTIIYAALEGAGYTFTEKHKASGPKYQWLDEVVDEVANTPSQSPFVHFTYAKENYEQSTPPTSRKSPRALLLRPRLTVFTIWRWTNR